jgi:hypothetical protein
MLRRKEKEKINHPFSNFIFMNINFFIYLSSNNQSIIRIPRTIREKKNEREYYCFMKDINERTNLLRQQKPNTHTEKKKKRLCSDKLEILNNKEEKIICIYNTLMLLFVVTYCWKEEDNSSSSSIFHIGIATMLYE